MSCVTSPAKYLSDLLGWMHSVSEPWAGVSPGSILTTIRNINVGSKAQQSEIDAQKLHREFNPGPLRTKCHITTQNHAAAFVVVQISIVFLYCYHYLYVM